MNEMILLYHAQQKVFDILDQMQVPYKIIQDDQLHETLGFLFDLEGFPSSTKKETAAFDFDFMMMHDIPDERLEEIIQNLKQNDANIERKAMLTAHNQHWTMAALLKEIDKEHTYFKVYDNIMRHLQKADSYQKDDYPKESWISYQDAFIEAYSILQSRPEDIEILLSAQNKLLQAETQLVQQKL